MRSKRVEYLFINTDPVSNLTTLFVARKKSNNILVRFGSSSIIWGTFVGTGKMTFRLQGV